MVIAGTKYRFTVAEYQRMGASGIFPEDARVELIEGEILAMSPIGSRHAACVNRLTALLPAVLAKRALLSVQNPIDLNTRTEPVPDLALLRPRDDYYESSLPTASDVLLVIEVADSSLEYDRTVKGPLYARAGIPEYWLVNLRDDVIEAYREPQNGAYQVGDTLRRGDELRARDLPTLALPVVTIFG